MFPSCRSASTLAAFAPLGPGAIARSPPSSLICGHPTPLPHRRASGLPSAAPYQLGKRWFCARWPSRHGAGRRTACRRRRVGEDHRFSVARSLPTGRSGVSRVTASSSSAVPRSTTPPVPLRLALTPPEMLLSGVSNPCAPEHRDFGAAFPRPTRSPDYASTAPLREQLQAWLPACWLRFDWGRVGHRRGIGRRTGSRCFPAPPRDSPVPHSVPRPVSCVPLYHPGRRDFPGPVGNEGISSCRLPGSARQVKRMARIRRPRPVCCTARPLRDLTCSPGSVS
jgi:hypothetical protein